MTTGDLERLARFDAAIAADDLDAFCGWLEHYRYTIGGRYNLDSDYPYTMMWVGAAVGKQKAPRIMTFLLDHPEFMPNHKISDVLCAACSWGNLELASKLKARGAQPPPYMARKILENGNRDVILWAIEQDYISVLNMRELIENGADLVILEAWVQRNIATKRKIPFKSFCEYAFMNRRPDVLTWLEERGYHTMTKKMYDHCMFKMNETYMNGEYVLSPEMRAWLLQAGRRLFSTPSTDLPNVQALSLHE